MLGKNDPVRSFGTLNRTSPARVVNSRGRDPLRSVTRDSVRSYRPAPIAAVASASISSCIATRTHSRMKSVPSPVQNTSSNPDTAESGKAVGEISFDEYLAVHIKNLAGGPFSQEAVPSPKPHHSAVHHRPPGVHSSTTLNPSAAWHRTQEPPWARPPFRGHFLLEARTQVRGHIS
jgi:hypothetical protein